VIATLAFERTGRVRRARFVRRPSVPLDAACVVANGIREALRALLGESCTVTLGEPAALDPAGWRTLSRGALAFAAPGRATDVVFLVPRRDARRLVQAAFGEAPAPHDEGWSALEAGAIERIVARCAGACDVLCAERRGPTRAVDPAGLPPCVAFFDVRVGAPIALTLGVGIARELPEPAPARTLPAAALDPLALDVQVVLGHATLAAPRLLALRVGDTVPLVTKVAGGGELNVAGQRIATGSGGVVAGHAAFAIDSMISMVMRGTAW
jgi:flagellar motor switch/type III secretory pathway protein FliN